MAESSQIAQLAASLYIPIPECSSTADVLGKSLIPSRLFRTHPVPTVSQLLFTGPIHEIDARITLYQRRLSTSSRSDPSRPVFVLFLAMTRLKRHMLSSQREDLEKSILRFTESILLPLRSRLDPHGLLILQALFLLSLALVMRSTLSKQSEDAIYAAKYLRHLRDQPHQAFGFPRHQVTTLLVGALAFQAELEAGNVMQNIEEMAVLCHELFTSGASDGDTTRSITLFSRVVSSKIRLGVPNQPLDRPIECLRATRKHKPDLRAARFALAHSLGCRYCTTLVNDDYEEAASVLDEIITSSSPGDSEDEFVAQAQRFVTALAMTRSKAHQNPEYSEEAIYRARAFLASSSVEGPFRSAIAFDLEGIAKQRFRYFGSIEGLDPEARSSVSPLSLSQLVLAFEEYEDDNSEVGRIMENIGLLEGFLSVIHNNDITKIDEVINEG